MSRTMKTTRRGLFGIAGAIFAAPFVPKIVKSQELATGIINTNGENGHLCAWDKSGNMLSAAYHPGKSGQVLTGYGPGEAPQWVDFNPLPESSPKPPLDVPKLSPLDKEKD